MRTTRFAVRWNEAIEGSRRDGDFDRTGEFRRPSADHRVRGSWRVRD